MYYYCIGYLYSETRNGIFHHLPVSSQVTNDLETAKKWFEDAVRVHTDSWRGNKLLYVKDRKLDYMCMIKEALFECNEAAYQKGFYSIELQCYTHNPFA